MLADLDGHRPEKIEFCLTEAQKEMFKDVLVLCEGAKSADEPIKVLHDKFNALFPDNEVVDRKYDDFEIHAIREEYCIKQENDVPKRKEELETVLAQIKTMKKNAEEAYASALLEVSDLAARVKNGITEYSSDIAKMNTPSIYGWRRRKKKYIKATKPILSNILEGFRLNLSIILSHTFCSY